MSQITEAASPESVLALLRDARGAIRVHNCSGGRQAAMLLIRQSIGQVGIDQATFAMDFDADVAPAGQLVFGHVSSGAVGFRRDSAENWHTAGDVYLAARLNERRTTMIRGGRHQQAVIQPGLISQLADAEPGRSGQPVRFTGHRPVSADAARQWKITYAYVRDTLLADPAATAHPLITASAGRLLAAAALTAFPNDARTDSTIEDRHDAHPAALRRAVAYIDEHAHRDISLADIAAAAFVTTRAVQLAFRRHLDTTPTEYLRRVRLGRAHHDLGAANPASSTVTAVAYRWGFASPSRFARYYRHAYGVAPGYTLRRG